MPDRSTPDPLFPLSELPHRPWMPRKNGKPINKYTVCRWATTGKKGRRLQTLMVGGTRCCSDRWAMEFFEALTQGPAPSHPPHTPRKLRQDFLEAEAELDAEGL